MKVYLCLDDHGRYPYLVIVVAHDLNEAKQVLLQRLDKDGISFKFEFYKITEVDTSAVSTFEFEMAGY